MPPIVRQGELFRAAQSRIQGFMTGVKVRAFPLDVSKVIPPRQSKEIWIAWKRVSPEPKMSGPQSSVIQVDRCMLILAFLDRSEVDGTGPIDMSDDVREFMSGWSYNNLPQFYSEGLNFVMLANNFWAYQEIYNANIPYSRQFHDVPKNPPQAEN